MPPMGVEWVRRTAHGHDRRLRDGSEDTRRTSQRMTFRITRALDSLLTTAKAIKGDKVAAEDMTASVPTLRLSLKQVGHRV